MRSSVPMFPYVSHCQYERSLCMNVRGKSRGVPFIKHVGMQFVLD